MATTLKSKEEILKAIQAGEISVEEATKLLDGRKGLTCEVGPAGGVMVKGLQRMPVTLYKDQWVRLAEYMENVLDFIIANEGQLSKGKEDSKARKEQAELDRLALEQAKKELEVEQAAAAKAAFDERVKQAKLQLAAKS